MRRPIIRLWRRRNCIRAPETSETSAAGHPSSDRERNRCSRRGLDTRHDEPSGSIGPKRSVSAAYFELANHPGAGSGEPAHGQWPSRRAAGHEPCDSPSSRSGRIAQRLAGGRHQPRHACARSDSLNGPVTERGKPGVTWPCRVRTGYSRAPEPLQSLTRIVSVLVKCHEGAR